jgi:hypothetical protein
VVAHPSSASLCIRCRDTRTPRIQTLDSLHHLGEIRPCAYSSTPRTPTPTSSLPRQSGWRNRLQEILSSSFFSLYCSFRTTRKFKNFMSTMLCQYAHCFHTFYNTIRVGLNADAMNRKRPTLSLLEIPLSKPPEVSLFASILIKFNGQRNN